MKTRTIRDAGIEIQNSINQQKDFQQQLQQQIDELKAKVEAKKAEGARIAAQPTPSFPPAPVAQASGSHQDWLMQAGIPESDWSNMDYIITRESGWNPAAVNKSSGATGLCQSLPASKMASAGLDYLTNPTTQLKWCYNYGVSRYGSISNAVSFWRSRHWW